MILKRQGAWGVDRVLRSGSGDGGGGESIEGGNFSWPYYPLLFHSTIPPRKVFLYISYEKFTYK